jgi:lambda family phage tail tape measure protein
MAVGQISVVLTLNNSQFTVAMARNGVVVSRFASQVQNTSGAILGMGRSLNGFSTHVRNFFITLALARSAMLNMWAATGQWQKSIVDTSAKLQRMQMLLKGLSTASTEQEKLNDAQRDFNSIIDLSMKAPFTVDAITDSWVKFRSAGLDPTTGSLQALVDAVAKFGGTDEHLKRASVAIQQMSGKGVISMEELRQQLGEAVPTAMQMMARGMGMSMGQLVKEISTGTVAAGTALEKMFVEFEMAFGGSAQQMMGTFAGQVNKLKTQWMLLQDQVAKDSGLMDYLQRQLILLNAYMDPALTAGIARTVGGAMKQTAQYLVEGITFIFRYREEIKTLMVALGGWWLTMRVGVTAFTTLAAAWRGFGTVIRAANIALHARTLTRAFTALSTVLPRVAAGFGALALSNPLVFLAALTAGIVALVAWLNKLNNSVDGALDRLEKLAEFGFVDSKAFRDATEDLREAREVVRQLDEQVKNLEKKEGRQKNLAIPENVRAREAQLLAERRAELAAATEKLTKAEETYSKIQALNDRRVRNEAESTGRYRVDVEISKIQEDFRRENEELAKQYDDLAKNDKAGRQKIIDDRVKLLRDYAEKAKTVFDEIERELREKADAPHNTKEVALAYNAELDALQKRRDQFAKDNERMVATLLKPNEKIASSSGADGAMSKIEERIASIRARVAELKEDLVGGDGLEAKMNSLVNSGFFNSKGERPAQHLIDQLREVARAQDEAERATKAHKAAQEAMTNTGEALGRWLEQSKEELRQWNDQLETGSTERADSRLRQFERTLASLRAQAESAGISMQEFNATIEEIRETIAKSTYAKKMTELMEQEQDLNLQLVQGTRARFEAELELNRRRLEAFLEANKAMSESDKQALLDQAARIDAAKAKLYEMQTPLGELARRWADFSQNMQQATAGWMDDFVDRLVDGLEAGKLSFKDFAKDILKQLAKIMIMKQLAGFAGSLSNWAVGGGAGAGSVGGTGAGGMNLASTGALYAEKGGVISAKGLHKYAKGGIANRPQVAVFGEGDQPEAFVPLPDGRTIPVTLRGGGASKEGSKAPNISVNVINQSGSQVTAEQGQMRFDGNSYVLDVVLKGLSRPGPFRDGMKSALR